MEFRPDIALTEKSPYVKPLNARKLVVFEYDGTGDLDGSTYPVVQIRGARGKVLGTVNTTVEDMLAFCREFTESYGE